MNFSATFVNTGVKSMVGFKFIFVEYSPQLNGEVKIEKQMVDRKTTRLPILKYFKLKTMC